MDKYMASVNEQNNYRVLFITKQYAPNPRACDICVRNVREALDKLGVMSDVIQFVGKEGEGDIPGGKLYSVGAKNSKNNLTEGNGLINFFRKLMVAYRWPLQFNYKLNKRIKTRIAELNNINRYDAIIGVALPIDTAIAGCGFNNYILYELDALSNNPANKGLVKKMLMYRVKKIEKMIFEQASLIIHMEYNRVYFGKSEYNHYRTKSVYADIPNLLPLKKVDVSQNNEEVVCAYFGALLKNIRNPSYLIKIMDAISKKIKICCEFYSRGNCEDILKRAVAQNPNVIKMEGYVPTEVVVERQNRADFLISIGNNLAGDDRSFPSKTIEYISTGKPIIHIGGGVNDSAISYLDKYGNSCIINPNDSFEFNVNKVKEFIYKTKGNVVSFEKTKKTFYRNTPEYTALIIKNYLSRLKRC